MITHPIAPAVAALLALWPAVGWADQNVMFLNGNAGPSNWTLFGQTTCISRDGVGNSVQTPCYNSSGVEWAPEQSDIPLLSNNGVIPWCGKDSPASVCMTRPPQADGPPEALCLPQNNTDQVTDHYLVPCSSLPTQHCLTLTLTPGSHIDDIGNLSGYAVTLSNAKDGGVMVKVCGK